MDRRVCDHGGQESSALFGQEHPAGGIRPQFLQPVVFRQVLQAPHRHVAHRIPEQLRPEGHLVFSIEYLLFGVYFLLYFRILADLFMMPLHGRQTGYFCL